MGLGDGVGDNVTLQPGDLTGTPTSVEDPLTNNSDYQLRLVIDFVSDNAIWIVLLSTLFIKNKTVLALLILTLVVFVNHKSDLDDKGNYNAR